MFNVIHSLPQAKVMHLSKGLLLLSQQTHFIISGGPGCVCHQERLDTISRLGMSTLTQNTKSPFLQSLQNAKSVNMHLKLMNNSLSRSKSSID